MNNRGILIVLSGFSGAGKGTVVKNILKTYPDEYAVSPSPRPMPGQASTH